MTGTLRGILFGTSIALAGWSAAPAAGGADTRRIQRLEDEIAIRELLLDYGRTLDTRDYAGYAALFARDGVWIGSSGPWKGPAAIRAMLERSLKVAAGTPNTSNFHLLTNAQVKVDGDRATALSKLVFVTRSAENRPAMTLSGHYVDTLTREDGRWKFLRREVHGDIPFMDPLAPKPAPKQ